MRGEDDDCDDGAYQNATFYVDADGDTYGTGSAVTMSWRCDRSAPAGYATRAGDCCDADVDAHPGATAYRRTANRCGNYEYNCDGVITVEPPTLGSTCNGCSFSGATPMCVAGSLNSGWCTTPTAADCGTMRPKCRCVNVDASMGTYCTGPATCNPTPASYGSAPVQCR